MAVNRINSFGDSLLDEVMNGTNLSKNLKPNKEEKEEKWKIKLNAQGKAYSLYLWDEFV